jgi:hypothetical protein
MFLNFCSAALTRHHPLHPERTRRRAQHRGTSTHSLFCISHAAACQICLSRHARQMSMDILCALVDHASPDIVANLLSTAFPVLVNRVSA